MSDWYDIEQWTRCERLAKPGHVFEVVNGDGQSLFTTCVQPLPTPRNWASAPLRFRLVPEAPPRRSSPLPEPQRR